MYEKDIYALCAYAILTYPYKLAPTFPTLSLYTMLTLLFIFSYCCTKMLACLYLKSRASVINKRLAWLRKTYVTLSKYHTYIFATKCELTHLEKYIIAFWVLVRCVCNGNQLFRG